jgi:hypothetical protein
LSEERAEHEVGADVPEATFEDILSQYQQEEGEFEYIVGEGENARKFRAVRLVNLQEKIELTELADKFMATANKKEPPKEWQPFLKKRPGRKVCMMIIYASSLLVSPKLTQLQCLQLAATGSDALIEIAGPLLGAVANDVAETEDAEIDELKNV